MYLDWGKSFTNVKAPRAHLFATLTESIDNVTMDFEREVVEFNGVGYPFDLLGLGSQNDTSYNMTYTIKGTYEDASGKFS